MSCLLGVVDSKNGIGTIWPLKLRTPDATLVGYGRVDFLTVQSVAASTSFFAMDISALAATSGTCRPGPRPVRPSRPRASTRCMGRGASVSMVSTEAEDLAGFVGDGTSMPLLQGGTAVVVFGYLLWVNPILAGFAALLYLPQVAIVPLTQRGINRNAVIYAKVIRKAGDIIVSLSRANSGDEKTAGRFNRAQQCLPDGSLHRRGQSRTAGCSSNIEAA